MSGRVTLDNDWNPLW